MSLWFVARAVDLCAGEYTVYDIDGQLLDIVERGDEFVFVWTRDYNLPRLVELAKRGAELDGREWPDTDDPLLDLANLDRRGTHEWVHRPRRLARLLRRPHEEPPPLELYTR